MFYRMVFMFAIAASFITPLAADEIELRQTACRLFDSRQIGGLNAGPKITSATIETTNTSLDTVAFTSNGRSYNAQGGEAGCRVPSTASGVILNVVLFQPDSVGNATIWPLGSTQPLSTSINSSGALNEVAGVIVTLGTNGRLSLNSTITGAGSHYVIDLVGSTEGPAGAVDGAHRNRTFSTWANAPYAPGSLAAGTRVLVDWRGGVGVFSGHEGQYSIWNGSFWEFETPLDGDVAYEQSSGRHWVYYAVLGSDGWRRLVIESF